MQNKQSPSCYRPIVPATPTQTFVPLSPYNLPQTVLPPFETPPASPFSQPMHNYNGYNGQPVFKLPPPLSPIAMHGCQPKLSSSPTSNIAHQQNGSPIQSSHSRSDHILSNQHSPLILPNQHSPHILPNQPSPHILPNQPSPHILPHHSSPLTSVFPVSMAPSSAHIALETSSVQGAVRPTMQHHTSIIHTLTSHNRSSISSDKPLTTADQRELARKVSHSAIERRRRERINDKIMQLKELIPSCADQDHLNKLCILQSSIEYIQYLQDLVVTYRQRDQDGGRTNGNRSSEDDRVVKRSKFDRYDILPSSKISSRIFETSNNKECNRKRSSSASSSSSDQTMDHIVNTEKAICDDSNSTISDTTPISLDREEAGTLLSSTTTVKESERIVTTRNSETQTSTHDLEKSFIEFKNLQETQDSETVRESEKSPRRGMTVQQLLC